MDKSIPDPEEQRKSEYPPERSSNGPDSGHDQPNTNGSTPTDEPSHASTTTSYDDVIRHIKPGDYPLTVLDHHELREDRGLAEETIQHCKYGSIRTQEQLTHLGLDWSFDGLPSTILIPYPGTEDANRARLFRFHKRSLPSSDMPPYELEQEFAKGVVLVESEFKAAAAWQLGYTAIGLQGIHSHIHRTRAIVAACHRLKAVDNPLYIHLDTEKWGDTGVKDSRIAALAYAYELGRDVGPCRIVDLPDKYLQECFDGQERKYHKADLDGALAAGLTVEEWGDCVAHGTTFLEALDSVGVKLQAMQLAAGESILDRVKDVEEVLKDVPPTEAADAVTEFCDRVRSLAYDKSKQVLDETRLAALVQPVHNLFRNTCAKLPVGHVRTLITEGSGSAESKQAPTLAERGIVIRGNQAFHRNGGRAYELIANVVPDSIRSGRVRYRMGRSTPRHLVTVQGRKREIEILGSIYEPKSWENSGEGEVTVARPADFKSLIDYTVTVAGAAGADKGVDQVLWVGTFRDADGALTWRDNVRFPYDEEECPYARRTFPENGDTEILNKIAALHSDGVAAVWLAADLGSVFKPVLGDAYPHIAVVGDSGTGKSTIADEMIKRLGRRRYSAGAQLSTAYRFKKTVANTNVPVIIDEIQRLPHRFHPMAIDTLNGAYNLQLATHGDNEKVFVLGAPAVLLGQDLPFEDVALNTKMIRLTLDANNRDAAALETLWKTDAVAPYREWLAFACYYANQVDVRSARDNKAKWLRSALADCDYEETTNTSRAFQNYACVLVAAEALAEFGVDLDIDNRVASLLRDHLKAGQDEATGCDRSSIGKQFIHDLVAELQTPSSRYAFPWIVEGGDLYFALGKAMDHLMRQGRLYDAITSQAMARQLKAEGVTFERRRRINGVQTRCSRIPASVLNKLDCDVSGLGGDGSGSPREL